MKHLVEYKEEVAGNAKGFRQLLPLQLAFILESQGKVKLMGKPLRNREARELKFEQKAKPKKEAKKPKEAKKKKEAEKKKEEKKK